MSTENDENNIQKINMYHDFEISEKQINEGKVKDARDALNSVREKYNL